MQIRAVLALLAASLAASATLLAQTPPPDRTLYENALANIERGNYAAARLSLNTLVNQYDDSGYVLWAKLAIANSWLREGGAHGLAQAEAEYKDFALFYPTFRELRGHIVIAADNALPTADSSVLLAITVSSEGRPGSVKVLNAPADPRFANAAVDAVRKWRLDPAQVDGQPIAIVTTVQIDFTPLPQ